MSESNFSCLGKHTSSRSIVSWKHRDRMTKRTYPWQWLFAAVGMHDKYRQPEQAIENLRQAATNDRWLWHTCIGVRSVKVPDEHHVEYDGHRDGSNFDCPGNQPMAFCFADHRIEHSSNEESHDKAANVSWKLTGRLFQGVPRPRKTNQSYQHLPNILSKFSRRDIADLHGI